MNPKPQKLFVIRDDDLSFFNSPDDIKNWYNELFTMKIPVGFSTIPFATVHTDFHQNKGGEQNREYSISQNRELVEYVKSNPHIEIMLHGCNHENINGRYEYQVSSGLFEKTIRGKQELEQTFGTVSVFVPPHDQISNHGILAIEHANLNIIRSKGSKNFLPRVSYIIAAVKMVWHILKFKFLGKILPAYPHTINFGNHQEAFSARIELGMPKLFEMMKWSIARNGNFVIVTHINDMTEDKKLMLLACIAEARRLGYSFAKPSELFYGTKN